MNASSHDGILVIGVGAETKALIDASSDEGRLPSLERLFEGGHGKPHSAPNVCSTTTWSSTVTGVIPAMHGIYSLADCAPKSCECSYTHTSRRHADTPCSAHESEMISDLLRGTGYVE